MGCKLPCDPAAPPPPSNCACAVPRASNANRTQASMLGRAWGSLNCSWGQSIESTTDASAWQRNCASEPSCEMRAAERCGQGGGAQASAGVDGQGRRAPRGRGIGRQAARHCRLQPAPGRRRGPGHAVSCARARSHRRIRAGWRGAQAFAVVARRRRRGTRDLLTRFAARASPSGGPKGHGPPRWHRSVIVRARARDRSGRRRCAQTNEKSGTWRTGSLWLAHKCIPAQLAARCGSTPWAGRPRSHPRYCTACSK